MSSSFRALDKPTFGSLLRAVALTAVCAVLFVALRSSQHRAAAIRSAARPETGTVLGIDRRQEEIVIDDDPECRHGDRSKTLCRTRMVDRFFVSYAYGAAREHTGTFEGNANVTAYLKVGDQFPILVDADDAQLSEPADDTLVAGGTASGALLIFTYLAGAAAALAAVWLVWTIVRMVT